MKYTIVLVSLLATLASIASAGSTCEQHAKAALGARFDVDGEALDARYAKARELFTAGEILVHSLSLQALTPGTEQFDEAGDGFRACTLGGDPGDFVQLYRERLAWAANESMPERRQVRTAPKAQPTKESSEMVELRTQIRMLQSQLAEVQRKSAAAEKRYKELTGWKGFVTSMANGVANMDRLAERRRIEEEYRSYMYQRNLERQMLQSTLDDVLYSVRELEREIEDIPNCHGILPSLDLRCEQW